MEDFSNDRINNEFLRKALRLRESETPFPWQEELLRRFLRGSIPPALDIPTGLGKTAVMAIWLIARAGGAALPRRLVYIVDRRAVVDQATDVAIALHDLVDSNADLKTRLRLDDNRSLPISTLRGKHVDNHEWLEDPSSPAIIVGTVDMIGSRLLFEGYGVSRKMRPYHAGLLGADALIVLDEAHLVPPFEMLLKFIAERDADFRPTDKLLDKLVPRFRLLSLSATGRTLGEDSIRLEKADLNHEELKKRLNAEKCLLLKLNNEDTDSAQTEANINQKEKWSISEELAKEAWKIVENGTNNTRIIIFCNCRKDASDTKSAVEKLAKGDKKAGKGPVLIHSELFVGGRRIYEREEAKMRLVKFGFIAGSEQTPDRPTFLFATSAAEVGVDLDADHMVCDLVAWERMVQRLGRVNRRGNCTANVTVVMEPEPKPKNKKEKDVINKKASGKSLEEKEIKILDAFEARVREWKNYQKPFRHLPLISNGAFDASPGALSNLKQRAESDKELGEILRNATTPTPLRPVLTRALVDAWSMTSLKEHTGRPMIDPWLRGWKKDELHTNIVWRAHLPLRSSSKPPAKKEIEQFFEAAPPHASEVLEEETYRVVQWLEKRAVAVLKNATHNPSTTVRPLLPSSDEVVAFILSRSGDFQDHLRFKDLITTDNGDSQSKQQMRLRQTLGGAILVVDSILGGLKDGLLDEKEDSLPKTTDDGQEWLGEHVAGFRIRSVRADESLGSDPSWRERFRFATKLTEEGEPRLWLIVEKWRHEATTEDDRSSSHPQILEEHQSWAEDRARNLAQKLQLDEPYLKMLAIVARLHDEGKRFRRWQRGFNASKDGIYAKTKGPINYALLDGYRHELGSLLIAENDEKINSLSEELRELALHLIAAHHGFARPVIGTHGCEDAPPSVVETRTCEVALRFSRLQRRWGPWGLAWWETLLRAVDQQASRENDAAELVIQKEEF